MGKPRSTNQAWLSEWLNSGEVTEQDRKLVVNFIRSTFHYESPTMPLSVGLASKHTPKGFLEALAKQMS